MEDVGAKIDLLRPIKFHTNTSGYPENKHIGFLAEEMADVFPEFTVYGSDGITPFSIMYAEIVAILTKEIQSLRSRVYALENP